MKQNRFMLVIIVIVVIIIISLVMSNKYKPEVFSLEALKRHPDYPRWPQPYGWWEELIKPYEFKIATKQQLDDAYAAGAQWCAWSFIDDGTRSTAAYPMQETKLGCGTKGINIVQDAVASRLNVYGIKPAKDKTFDNFSIRPFNDTKWSQWDK